MSSAANHAKRSHRSHGKHQSAMNAVSRRNYIDLSHQALREKKAYSSVLATLSRMLFQGFGRIKRDAK